jgi:nitric oxide reductase NorD protein
MDFTDQKKAFYALVAPSYPNEWEVDEALEILALADSGQRQALLSHVPAIWPISHSLCFSYLSAGVEGLSSISPELLSEWVRRILSSYEEGGLRRARDFMSDVEKNFLDPLRGRAGVTFAEMLGRMLPYIRGVSGLHLDLATDAYGRIWTDTRTIFLPESLNLFSAKEANLLYYKFAITVQWGFIAIGTYRQVPDPDLALHLAARYGGKRRGLGIDDFWSVFPDPDLARTIFHLLEFKRVFAMVAEELPGLVRQARPLLLQVLAGKADSSSVRSAKIHDILRSVVTSDISGGQVDAPPGEESQGYCQSFMRLPEVFDELYRLPGEPAVEALDILAGQLDYPAALAVIEQQRLEEKELFVRQLAAVLEPAGEGPKEEAGGSTGLLADADALMLVIPAVSPTGVEEIPRMIRVNNEEMLLPEELARSIARIEADLGTVPAAYIQAAVGMAGHGRSGRGEPPPEEDPQSVVEAVSLDEWDYRRAGYRKDWCSLFEKELPEVTSNFVPITLSKHRGLINRMKRQFEMLRTTHRFVRRRRYGDDLDFDAIVDALGDLRAGFAPSDRLFIRLLRDERDIAALFLVDMSNSTEGWIGTLIKESLVILGEVMEVAGDRYGIYGFSGMRRSRCEIFHVKHLDEGYGDEVRRRISAIGPREYTRMGPPIRHLTRLLQATDARLRLLITLSDGKPEDYDGYNDEYAIEDTRKALIEARGRGIHPFCINIDQKASNYLRHMYGAGNYVFVNTIENLPLKMVEFYRVLTS